MARRSAEESRNRKGNRMSVAASFTRREVQEMKRTTAEADAQARRSNAQEGLHLTKAHAALREKVVAGKMTEQEFRDHVISGYKKG